MSPAYTLRRICPVCPVFCVSCPVSSSSSRPAPSLFLLDLVHYPPPRGDISRTALDHARTHLHAAHTARCTLHTAQQAIKLQVAECWRWPSLFTMTSALSSNTCGVCVGYPSLVVRSSLLYPVSGDLDIMPGSLAEFALEHEFDDHHYFQNTWIRDIIASIVNVSLPSLSIPSLT